MEPNEERRMIIITPDDKITTALYSGFASIMEAVYGYPEFCGHETIPVDPQYEEGEEEVKVSTYCSRDLIISEDKQFDKINAVASLLMEKEIRGNLVVLADEGKGKNRGFLYLDRTFEGIVNELPCECWSAKKSLRSFVSEFYPHIKECHERFDGKKEISAGEFIALKAIEMSV